MKKLVFLSLLFCLSAFADSTRFQLDIQDNKRIIHNDDDWVFIKEENSYDFFSSKIVTQMEEDVYELHTVIDFSIPYTYTSFDEPTHKIYTYGLLNCREKMFMLLTQFYVKSDSEIQSIQPFRNGEYISEVERSGTARNEMYLKICSGEMV